MTEESERTFIALRNLETRASERHKDMSAIQWHHAKTASGPQRSNGTEEGHGRTEKKFILSTKTSFYLCFHLNDLKAPHHLRL